MRRSAGPAAGGTPEEPGGIPEEPGGIAEEPGGTPEESGGTPEGQGKHGPPVFLADRAELERGSITLSGAEGRHAANVRRLSVGERADVTDGAGTIAECVVTGTGSGVVELAVLAKRAVPVAEPRIVVVQAIPKGDRGELAVEIMTEVGVDAVVAWQAERCVARWRAERADRSLARWQATAREAAKQSRRAWIPEVTGPEATPAIVRRIAAAGLAILLDPEAPAALGRLGLPGHGEIVLIVGPEGGVSPAETQAMVHAGAVPARLGPTVMRSSSAGAVAAALALAGSGHWA
jgi:16S rRNA (uracil1498-N3)-methyltransferase